MDYIVNWENLTQKWVLVSQTWPRGIFDLRSHLVLECPFGKKKPYLRGSERRKPGFWEGVRFSVKSSPFVQDLARRRNERARAWVSSNLR